MQKCHNCQALFSGWGYICPTCESLKAIKDGIENNTRQNESISRENAIRQNVIAAQQQEIAQQQMLIDSQKLEAINQNNRLLVEQTITIDEAFAQGRNLSEFDHKLFDNDPNFYFTNPFLTPKLSKAYEEGVSQRLSDYSVGDAWLGSLKSQIISIAVEKRNLFLENEGIVNEIEGGVFYAPVSVKHNGIVVNYGYLNIDLRTNINESTGEIAFASQDYASVTACSLINDFFNEGFQRETLLSYVNEDNKKLLRLRNVLIHKIDQCESTIAWCKEQNNEIGGKNLTRIIAYGGFIFGVYLFFNGFFSMIGAFFVWLISAVLLGGKWSLDEKHNINNLRNDLVILNNKLNKVDAEIYESSSNMTPNLSSVKSSVASSKGSPILKLIFWATIFVFGIYYYKPSLLPQVILNFIDVYVHDAIGIMKDISLKFKVFMFKINQIF